MQEQKQSLRMRHKDSKRLIFLMMLFATLVVLWLSSCKGKEEASQAPAERPAKMGEIVITVNNGAIEGDEKRHEEQRLLNELFMKKYPGARLYFNPWQYSPETFMLRMSGGTCTDVVSLYATEATVVIEKRLAVDITDMVKAWDKYKYINESVLKPITRKGRIYGLPTGGIGGCYVMTLFYNKDLFKAAGIKKPPDTWDEFIQVAKNLTDRKKGQAGFGILGEKGGAGWHFLNWVWQAGGDFEVKKEGRWQAVFGSPEAIRALQFIKDLRWKYKVLQSNVLCDNDDLFELFAAERIAMAIFTPEYLVHLIEKYKMPLEKIGIALLPAGPGGRANQMGGAYVTINPTISKEKQKWAFRAIIFDCELDTIELRCKIMKRQERIFGFGVLPVFHGEYQDKIEAIVDKYRTIPGQKELMREAARYIHPEPPYYSQQLYSDFLGPSVQAVLTDKNADPAALLKRAEKDFQHRFLDKIKGER